MRIVFMMPMTQAMMAEPVNAKAASPKPKPEPEVEASRRKKATLSEGTKAEILLSKLDRAAARIAVARQGLLEAITSTVLSGDTGPLTRAAFHAVKTADTALSDILAD